MPGDLPVGIPDDLKSDWLGASVAITSDPLDVDPLPAWMDRVGVNIAQLANASSAKHGFTSVDSGFTEYVLNQPTGAESLVPTVTGGHYRLTAPGTVTDVNYRTIRTAARAGVMGNSEVRSTWMAQSTAMADSHARFQPGHAHRVTAPKQVDERNQATAGGASTLTRTGAGWATNQWAGAPAFQVQQYVTIIGGTGLGQTRRIISNTATVLTVDAAWGTNPDSTSVYEIWSRNVRAITITQNLAFNAHAIINVHTWDGPGFTPVGQVDLGSYLKPGGTYVQFPWFVKTRVVGRTVDLAIWKGSDTDANTPYGTAGRSASFTLPDTHDEPGQSGLYLGHLQAADWLEFDDLQVVRL